MGNLMKLFQKDSINKESLKLNLSNSLKRTS